MQEEGYAVIYKSPQMPYYRKLNEKVGTSLYRDHLNRMKRAEIVQIAQELKAKEGVEMKHGAKKTSKILTEKLERDITKLFKKQFGDEERLTREDVRGLFVKLQLFKDSE